MSFVTVVCNIPKHYCTNVAKKCLASFCPSLCACLALKWYVDATMLMSPFSPIATKVCSTFKNIAVLERNDSQICRVRQEHQFHWEMQYITLPCITWIQLRTTVEKTSLASVAVSFLADTLCTKRLFLNTWHRRQTCSLGITTKR